MKRVAVLVLLALASCGRAKAWDVEVAALDGLRQQATTAEFLDSPALDELLAAFDEAAPALKRGLESPSWAVRARCLYVACSNHLYDVDGLDTSMGMGDPSPEVQAVYASYAGVCAPGGGSLHQQPAVQAVLKRRPLVFRESLSGLPPALYRRRLDRIFEILEDPAPLAAPVATIDDGGGARLKPRSNAALGCLANELQRAPEGHRLVERFLAALKAVPADRTDRLAVMLDLAQGLSNHRDPSHPEGERRACPKGEAYAGALGALLRERVGMDAPPYLLYIAMFLLQEDKEGLVFLKRVERDHPDPAVRASAAWHVREKAAK